MSNLPDPLADGRRPAAGPPTRGAVRRQVAAFVFFALLTAVHTWPLVSAPGILSRNDTGDAMLNEWALAWVAHQAVTDPLHLFDANIFYPEKNTLSLSEHLVPQAAMVAPLLWAGTSPVLAHNVALLLGLTLTGWAWFHLIGRWTGSTWAGLVAGSLAAFNAHTLTRIAHVQAMHVEFLPLALAALDRVLRAPRVRHAAALGGWFALQGLTSGYFLLFSTVSVVVAAAARGREWIGARSWRTLLLLLLSAAVASALLLPFMLAYREARASFGLVRQPQETLAFSARLTDYLATGARLHQPWLGRFFRADGLFPGVLCLLLAAASLAAGVAWRDRRARLLLAIAIATFCLSFGFAFPGYGWLYRHTALFDAIRAPIRFGQFTLVALAGLAGFGTALVMARLQNGRAALLVGAALVAIANLEAMRAPMGYVPYQREPAILEPLAQVPNAVLAHFPFPSQPGAVGVNARYMLWSTRHWRPMLNGYSGLMPESFLRHARGVRAFPLPESLAYLRSAGVTHVVVDAGRLSRPRLDLLEQSTELKLLAEKEYLRLYELADGRQ